MLQYHTEIAIRCQVLFTKVRTVHTLHGRPVSIWPKVFLKDLNTTGSTFDQTMQGICEGWQRCCAPQPSGSTFLVFAESAGGSPGPHSLMHRCSAPDSAVMKRFPRAGSWKGMERGAGRLHTVHSVTAEDIAV